MDAFGLGNLQLGVATSATQIEGGDSENSWNDWFSAGHIKDGSDPKIACKHASLLESDCALMKTMGLKIYRFSLEWAKIEPRRGEFSQQAAEYYLHEIRLLKSYGIEPLVTFHHFTNPRWFEQMGAFESSQAVDVFCEYVEHMTVILGKEVNEYCTINEPNVYGVLGYVAGDWPPGVKKSMKRAVSVLETMAICHIKCYSIIHDIRIKMGLYDTKVGFANHLRVFESGGKFLSKHVCKYVENAFQSAATIAFNTGKFNKPFKAHPQIPEGKYYDYIGINYYTRCIIKGFKLTVPKDCQINDLGWEIYAKGLAHLIKQQNEMFPNVPIYITENGTADSKDSFRTQYIYDHLKAIVDTKLPVVKYYHWTFCDNFEWAEGNSAKFGLVEVDYNDYSRKMRKSGEFYSDIIKNNGVTYDMIKQYNLR